MHGPAMSELYTGRPYPFPPITDQSRPEDWPSMSSLAMRFGQPNNGLPPSIVLPWYLQFPGQSRLIAGQTAGRMGRSHDAVLVDGDPNKDNFRVKGFELADDVSIDRLDRRRNLLSQFERSGPIRTDRNIDVASRHRDTLRGFDFLQQQAGRAFNLDRETAAVRDAYGRTRIGQSLLLTRRLLEAGVPLITVNWAKQNRDQWDTHAKNYPRLKNMLPPFDRGRSTFLSDLKHRGLLETTLVVCVGECGRTPWINKDAGRDHWPDCYSVVLAGGGTRPGTVFGASSRHASYPTLYPVGPWDLGATMFHCLGIPPDQHIQNRRGQPIPLSPGRVIDGLLA